MSDYGARARAGPTFLQQCKRVYLPSESSDVSCRPASKQTQPSVPSKNSEAGLLENQGARSRAHFQTHPSTSEVQLPNLLLPTEAAAVNTQTQAVESQSQGSTSSGPRQPCAFYLKTGNCAFGSECKFAHPLDQPATQYNCLGLPLRPGEPECAYYVRNLHCGYGASCKFHHAEPVMYPMMNRGMELGSPMPYGAPLGTPQFGLPGPPPGGAAHPMMPEMSHSALTQQMMPHLAQIQMHPSQHIPMLGAPMMGYPPLIPGMPPQMLAHIGPGPMTMTAPLAHGLMYPGAFPPMGSPALMPGFPINQHARPIYSVLPGEPREAPSVSLEPSSGSSSKEHSKQKKRSRGRAGSRLPPTAVPSPPTSKSEPAAPLSDQGSTEGSVSRGQPASGDQTAAAELARMSLVRQ